MAGLTRKYACLSRMEVEILSHPHHFYRKRFLLRFISPFHRDSQKEFILCTICNLKHLEEFTEQVCDFDVLHRPLYRFKSKLLPYLHSTLEAYCWCRTAGAMKGTSVLYHSCQARASCRLLRQSGQSDRRYRFSWSADVVSGAADVACCPLPSSQYTWLASWFPSQMSHLSHLLAVLS